VGDSGKNRSKKPNGEDLKISEPHQFCGKGKIAKPLPKEKNRSWDIHSLGNNQDGHKSNGETKVRKNGIKKKKTMYNIW